MVAPTRPERLVDHSLRVLGRSQTLGGGYVACASYPTYRYVWVRDGSFIAEAMRRAGQVESAAAFHAFVARAVLSLVGADGATPALLPARFELDGGLDASDWPNFQTDGYGLWLWSLRRQAAEAPVDAVVMRACAVAATYLSEHWREPCHDPWEEGGERLPVATLAASVAGLRAAQALLGPGPWWSAAADAWQLLRSEGVGGGRLLKDVGVQGGVDAATLWTLGPLALVAPDDPVFAATLTAVERRLMAPNVHRHPDDEYYGGGAWPILAAFWGLARLAGGDRGAARSALAWIESTADALGDLPEQVPEPMLHPEGLGRWTAERGPVARPLAWSHAMYLLLAAELAADGG